MRAVWLVGLLGCGANLAVPGGDDAADAPPSPDAAIDAASDAPGVLGPFGPPTPIDIVAVGDDDPSATGDLLELYFNRAQDILVTRRAAVTDPWGTPVVVAELSSPENDTTPEVSYDGLTIYLASNRPGGAGVLDIYRATRASRADAWGTPVRVPELSSATREASATTTDDLALVMEWDLAANQNDIYLATRASPQQPFGAPVLVPGINDGVAPDGNPMLSLDGLVLYFDSARSGDTDLYRATRLSPSAAFGPPTLIGELASAATADSDTWISPDQRTLYFTSNRDGTAKLWQATR